MVIPRRVAASIALTVLGLTASCSSSPAATDRMTTTTEHARQLAQSVAANGGCGGFEDYNFNRARDTWVFTCQKPGMSFEIVTYGSPEARSAGIKRLKDNGATYFTENFYAVTVVAFAGNGLADSALASFKK